MKLRRLVMLVLPCAAATACATAESARGPAADSVSGSTASTRPLSAPPLVLAPSEPPLQSPRVTQAPPPPAPSAVRPKAVAMTAEELSRDLEEALIAFEVRAKDSRQTSPHGSAMTAAESANWSQALGMLERYLARPAAFTPVSEVMRARATLEAELAEDGHAFGDFPPDLTERAVGNILLLSTRLMALRPPAPVAAEHPELIWPVQPVWVTSHFGERVHPIAGVLKPHAGVDLAAEHGQTVFAAAGGHVLRAGAHGGYGLQVEIEHAPGFVTSYSHLGQLLVKTGAEVERGQPLGLAGRTGASTGVHLHFEVLEEGRPVDPLGVLPWSSTPETLPGRSTPPTTVAGSGVDDG